MKAILGLVKPWRLLVFLWALILFPLTASAEKTNWVDESYDFSKVQKALVYDITLTDKAEMDNDLLEQVVAEDYLKKSQELDDLFSTNEIRRNYAANPEVSILIDHVGAG